MSRFTGKQGKGAMAFFRACKRQEAEARNAYAPENHSQSRGHSLGRCSCKRAAA